MGSVVNYYEFRRRQIIKEVDPEIIFDNDGYRKEYYESLEWRKLINNKDNKVERNDREAKY